MEGVLQSSRRVLHALQRLRGRFTYTMPYISKNIIQCFKWSNIFATIFFPLQDSMAQERLLQASKPPGASRNTRPQDISSDEEDDMVDFDPVVVTRTSPEGRMMSKWFPFHTTNLHTYIPTYIHIHSSSNALMHTYIHTYILSSYMHAYIG